jgi:NAD(P)-dependent dehydrogenase (short-subunit alcohol dehydrogenase family)
MAASLAVEWAKANIRVNCIVSWSQLSHRLSSGVQSPGYTVTVRGDLSFDLANAHDQPMSQAGMDSNPQFRPFWENATPMVRLFLRRQSSCNMSTGSPGRN